MPVSWFSFLMFRAKSMRREATPAEGIAWELLRNRRCLGYKFRRQHVIAGFIPDFYCAELRLAIELDGAPHFTQWGHERDSLRDGILAAAGVRVARIPNGELSQERLEAEIEGAVRSIGSGAHGKGRGPHPPAYLAPHSSESPPSPHSGEGDRG